MPRTASAIAFVSLLATSAAAQDDDFGKWIELFNGRDLEGWQNAKPDEGHHKGPNRWTVEDGALTNISRGVNDICTVPEFTDYELEIEYKIPKGGNSGVYLRGQIEIQVFDSFDKIAKGEKLTSVDAGAIYGGDFVALKNVQKAPGEWNKYRVLHVGHRITVWHNDTLIQDNVYADKPTGGAMSRYPGRKELTTERGPLMLQGDHEKVWYRNIRIRPLFAEGWEPLWNGSDLSEFNARDDARAKDGLRWEVRNNAFTNKATGGDGHDIWTNKSFGNFLVYYAYRSDTRERDTELDVPIRDRSGNSGFYLRDQWEIQILARQSTTNKHSDGALYSIEAPAVLARHESDQWNHMFVKMLGQEITVWQNGKQIHKGSVLKTRTDNHDVATPGFTKAPFKLQGDHAKVWFTNLRIKPLGDAAE